MSQDDLPEYAPPLPFAEVVEDNRPETGYSFSSATDFKAQVDQHKAEGWINLSEDRKAFVCMYVRDGYTTAAMVKRGCSAEEANGYLTDPLVQAAIADVSEQYATIYTFSAVGWRAKLARALDMAMGDAPMTIKRGHATIQIHEVDLAAATRLLDLAAKYRDIKDDPKDAIFDRFAKLPWEKR